MIRRFQSKAIEIVIQRKVSRKTAEAIKVLHLPGIRIVPSYKRFYPKNTLLANVLGFTNVENEGVYGLEKSYDNWLKARSRTITLESNRKGYPIYRKRSSIDTDLDGHNIYLTIEVPIQHIVEYELQRLVRQFKPKYAYAIMSNPNTGAIMAMAQSPSFNPNDRKSMNSDLWRNHMIADVYDPGSVMKPIAIAGALDHGAISSIHERINCENGLWYYRGHSLRDSGFSYDFLRIFEIIKRSSNIGTAKIALRLGEKRLYKVLRSFGFGEKTHIGLAPESSGILRHLNEWDGLSITRFPIGQGISVTPIQMVQAYNILANQGNMMQVHLIDRITDPNTGETHIFRPTIKRDRVIKPGVTHQIIMAMTTVTHPEGTGHRAAIPGYHVAAKTGTSQKLVNSHYSGHRKYVSSFIGMVPAYNPAFVLLVIADEPSTEEYYGSIVCGPTFKRIAEKTLSYLKISPTHH